MRYFKVIIIFSFLICSSAQAAGISVRAIKKNDVRKVKAAIKRGADVNKVSWFGRTPLMKAAIFNSTDVAKVLIDSGAEVNALDKNGWTALMWAAFKSSVETAELLIKNGADVTLQEKLNYTALKFAEGHGCKKMIKLLKEAEKQKRLKMKD